MPLVIRLDLLNGSHRLVHVRTCQNAFSHWKHCSKAGVLNDHWPPSRQITGRAITEPATPGCHIGILGDAPLRLGELDVPAIIFEVGANSHGTGDSPTCSRQPGRHTTSFIPVLSGSQRVGPHPSPSDFKNCRSNTAR